MTAIVTKESLIQMLTKDTAFAKRVVGKALVAIYQRQTSFEQSNNVTEVHNNIGFTGSDARSGSITAKTFIKKNDIEDWQFAMWTKENKNGVPRIAKYHKQLNEIALEKASRQVRLPL